MTTTTRGRVQTSDLASRGTDASRRPAAINLYHTLLCPSGRLAISTVVPFTEKTFTFAAYSSAASAAQVPPPLQLVSRVSLAGAQKNSSQTAFTLMTPLPATHYVAII